MVLSIFWSKPKDEMMIPIDCHVLRIGWNRQLEMDKRDQTTCGFQFKSCPQKIHVKLPSNPSKSLVIEISWNLLKSRDIWYTYIIYNRHCYCMIRSSHELQLGLSSQLYLLSAHCQVLLTWRLIFRQIHDEKAEKDRKDRGRRALWKAVFS